MKNVVLFLALGLATGWAYAREAVDSDRGGELNDSRIKFPPSVREIYECANSIEVSYFSDPPDGPRLLEWRALKYPEKFPAAAVSIFNREGFGEKRGPGFLTITPDKVIYTPAKLKIGDDGLETTQVTLNLQGKIDERWKLPVVDERGSSSASWYYKATMLKKVSGQPVYSYALGDLKRDHAEINPRDALTGDAATRALEELKLNLKTLVSAPAKRLVKLHLNSGRGYIPLSQITGVAETLCRCERLYPDVVKDQREKILSREFPLSVKEDGNTTARRILPDDFACRQGALL